VCFALPATSGWYSAKLKISALIFALPVGAPNESATQQVDASSSGLHESGKEVTTLIEIKLSALMGERRLKMAQLANATGISRRTIWRYYHAQPRMVDLAVLAKLCEHLGVTPGELLTWKGDKHS